MFSTYYFPSIMYFTNYQIIWRHLTNVTVSQNEVYTRNDSAYLNIKLGLLSTGPNSKPVSLSPNTVLCHHYIKLDSVTRNRIIQAWTWHIRSHVSELFQPSRLVVQVTEPSKSDSELPKTRLDFNPRPPSWLEPTLTRLSGLPFSKQRIAYPTPPCPIYSIT